MDVIGLTVHARRASIQAARWICHMGPGVDPPVSVEDREWCLCMLCMLQHMQSVHA